MNGRLKVALILSFCFLNGCIRVGPPYKAPPNPVYQEWKEIENPLLNEDNPVNWNVVFKDPRLQRLIDMALSQNYSLLAAASRIDEARARLQIATGAFFPQTQQAFGSWESVRISKNAPNAKFADRQFRNGLLGLNIAWELDFWGRYRSGIDAAEFGLQASEADYFGVQLLLISDIARSYINLTTLIEIAHVVEENIKLQRRSIEIILVRLEAGVVSELDLRQAQVLLSETERLLPATEKDIEAQKNALSVLLGTTPDKVSCMIDGDDFSIPFIPKTAAVGIPTNLLCQRPDLIAARRFILAQTAIVGIAKTDLLPRISLFGFIGFDAAYGNHLFNTNANRTFLSNNSLTYIFGPEFNWPLLNYGRIEGKIDLEWSKLEEMIQQYQNLVLNAYREAEDAMIAFIKGHEEKIILKEGVLSALRAYRLSQELYLEGLVDYERVLDSQRSLLAIQNQYVLNSGNIALSFVQMYQALGGPVNSHE